MKKLLQSFNKHAKKALFVGVSAASLLIGFNAQARVHESAPVTPTAIVLSEQTTEPVAAKPAAPKVKYAYSQERLDKIEANMKKTDLGVALLQFAADENITLAMSNSKDMDDNPKDNITIKGLNTSSLIRVNGDISSDDEIMITLAHEIRHSWHERFVKSDDLKLTPKDEWLKRRIQEADCFAFEVHFAYEYEKATGKTLDIGERNPQFGKVTYGSLLSDYSRARGDKNKTVGDAYSELLGKTFKYVHSVEYDKRFTTNLLDTWTNVANLPGLMPSYSDRMLNPTPDADFVAQMRKVATAGLKPGEDPAALGSWLDADFLGFEKTGGKPSKADQKTFDAAQKKYDEAKIAWQDITEKAKQPKPEEAAPVKPDTLVQPIAPPASPLPAPNAPNPTA